MLGKAVLGCKEPSEAFQTLPQAHSSSWITQPLPFTDEGTVAPLNQPQRTSNGVLLFPTAPAASMEPPPTIPATPPMLSEANPVLLPDPTAPAPSLCLGPFSPLCPQCPPQLCLCPSSSSSNVTLPTGLTDPSQDTSLRSPQRPGTHTQCWVI